MAIEVTLNDAVTLRSLRKTDAAALAEACRANLGYRIDARYAGRGPMTAAVGTVARLATGRLRLHRLQAGTLLHNAASQSVLRKCGFTEIGVAPAYLRIAGRWQDHRLFQRILTP